MNIVLITTLPGLEENKRIEEEVKALGHDFSLVDLNDFTFTISNGSLAVPHLSNLKADLVIVRGVFVAIKAISEIIKSYREKGIPVFDNNFLNHKYSIDKVIDLVKLSLGGVPVPDTSYTRNYEDFPRMADKIGYPVIFKSTRSGKGARVFKLNSEDELINLTKELEAKDKNAKSFMLQEFIDYQYDLRVLIIGDNVYAMRRIPSKGEFRANFSLGGSVELFDLDSAGKRLAKNALNAVGMSVGGVDILIDKQDSRYILEVNHTAGMLGMEKATGENITKKYIEHAIEKSTIK